MHTDDTKMKNILYDADIGLKLYVYMQGRFRLSEISKRS